MTWGPRSLSLPAPILPISDERTGWTPPAWPLTPPLTQYTDEYYQGDQTPLTAEIDVDHSITYGVTAAEDSFEYVLRAMHYV